MGGVVGEKGRINTAVGILAFTGGLVIYSTINSNFTVPEQIWGVAIGAATYFFSTAKRDEKRKDKDGDDR